VIAVGVGVGVAGKGVLVACAKRDAVRNGVSPGDTTSTEMHPSMASTSTRSVVAIHLHRVMLEVPSLAPKKRAAYQFDFSLTISGGQFAFPAWTYSSGLAQAQPESRCGLDMTRSITVSPAFVQPVNPGAPCHSRGHYMLVAQGYWTLIAAVAIPCPGRTQAQEIAHFMVDDNPDWEACVQSSRTTPNHRAKVMRV
jgi:hypothetical protein